MAQRKLNKTEFIKRLENNLFIGKFIRINTYKVLCLYGYQEKQDNEEIENEDEAQAEAKEEQVKSDIKKKSPLDFGIN